MRSSPSIPSIAALLLLAAALYVRALRVLRRRDLHVSSWQQTSWWIGIALLTIGLLGPPDAYDDRLLSLHMAQHLLIGDVAAPFLLLGMRTPLLLFYLPRSALVLLARRRWLRRAFARAAATARRAAGLRADRLRLALSRRCSRARCAIRCSTRSSTSRSCAANLLLWWPVIEPQRRRMGGQLWKIGYLFAARMATMFLGMVFVFARGVLYAGVYGRGLREGLSPHADQQAGRRHDDDARHRDHDVAACWFFWLASNEHDATGAHVSEQQPPARSRAAI